MNKLEKLPIDIFIKQITYLPFSDVINICQTNAKFHDYCTNQSYSTHWKSLIVNTFGDMENYQYSLRKVWNDLSLSENTYNYLVYTHLIKYLDPITQLMIYRKQGDDENFNNDKFSDSDRFIYAFLINNKEEAKMYFSKMNSMIANAYYKPFMNMMEGKKLSDDNLYLMVFTMADKGNIKGVKYLISKGADIYKNYDTTALTEASSKGYLDLVNYLVKDKNVDIHIHDDEALSQASYNGHLNVVKYLVENGANINNRNALNWAVMEGHLDVVKYLIEHGARITNETLRTAGDYAKTEILNYLTNVKK